MDLSIIIVNYKTQDKALKCVESVKASETAGLSCEIILIDNASGDDCQKITDKYSDVVFLRSEKNLGMGGGNNLGLKKARGECVMILNPDTLVKPDAIKKLYDLITRDDSAGIAAPKLLNANGSLQYSCFREIGFCIPILRRTFLGKYFKKNLDYFLMADFSHNGTKEVGWVMGSCFIIKRRLMDELGGFDERFFMYFEDTDLCRRVRQAGLKVVYYPEAIVIHDHARASADKPWYFFMLNKMSKVHIVSWVKYFWKWRTASK